MSARSTSGTRYPLRAVIRRTGLSADVLRAWERRYGAVQPVRSAGGQRLYSDEDVERLILLYRAVGAGHSIGEIARLDRVALEGLLDRSAIAGLRPSPVAIDAMVRDAMAAAEALDGIALESLLKRSAFAVATEPFIDDGIPRLLRAVGDRWHRGTLTPAHEHLASQAVKRVLSWMIDAYEQRVDAPRIVIATPAPDLHELGAMLVAATAAGEGWRVVYLGPNLPASDIVSAARQVGATAVALSVVFADGDATLRELRETSAGLPASAPLIIGGMAAARLERALSDTPIRVLRDLALLREQLRTLRDPSGSAESVAAD